MNKVQKQGKNFKNYYAAYISLILLFEVTVLPINLIFFTHKLRRKLLSLANKCVDPYEIKVYLDKYFKQVFLLLVKQYVV